MALAPLRALTPASNFSFVFMALTIVVAEFGGRTAALLTALSAALSLDFFLTEPYLRLSIEDKHDAIAFAGLAVCGLIAAALASERGRRLASLAALERQRTLMRAALADWDAAAPRAPQLERLLRGCRDAFPLCAAVVRDESGRTLACADVADEGRPTPGRVLEPDTLEAAGVESQGLGWDAPLPVAGGRIALVRDAQRLGWLDVWGKAGEPASAEARRALSDFARLLALRLA